jgi:hypothetical protein
MKAVDQCAEIIAAAAYGSRIGARCARLSGTTRDGLRCIFHAQSSSPGLSGRSSNPETAVLEPRGRGVLDHPHARVMTASGWRLCWHFQTWLRLLAARFARGLHDAVPREEEGAGNAGCALHPRSRVQSCTKENAHEHTGSAEAIRHSLRGCLTAYAVLSPATNSSCHRRWRI